ncbi:MAG: YabP/YqfC family sporulation protein [Clostridia bacterium]|nr:YabP/YqfC family sporulation protein [Clostridia bacterium]
MKNEERGDRRSLRQRVADRCRQPMEVFENLVVWRGQTCVTVYGCRRILQYTPTRICVLAGKRRLEIFGEQLICAAFCAGAITVKGRIHGVESVTRCPREGEA